MLVCTLPRRAEKGWLIMYLMLLPHRPALFMTSVIKTAGHKTAAFVVMFLQLSNQFLTRKEKKLKKNPPDCCMSVLFFFLEGRALDASLLQFSFKRKPMVMMILSCSILPCLL